MKYKKVCRALNYFEDFIAFVTAVSGCISISTFALLVGVLVGIAIYAVGLKFVQSQQELKSISQSSRKGEKSMII